MNHVEYKISEMYFEHKEYLATPEVTLEKLRMLPAHEGIFGNDNADLLLAIKQKAFREGYRRGYLYKESTIVKPPVIDWFLGLKLIAGIVICACLMVLPIALTI